MRKCHPSSTSRLFPVFPNSRTWAFAAFQDDTITTCIEPARSYVQIAVCLAPHLHATPTPWAVSSPLCPCSSLPRGPAGLAVSWSKFAPMHSARNHHPGGRRDNMENALITNAFLSEVPPVRFSDGACHQRAGEFAAFLAEASKASTPRTDRS